ncbi:hypothetical protein K402DRAFT_426519 [Aulographum hederae CBS 113979]|uniref:Aminoglycoside phosphotransferase domain-containing protein n=1 Tax=Aulographum hederae CBS 113979 TaxID=1176131 RepID=A0A6G1HHG4_9PEZI|nr:hypothetical protein K402DRAFT_426519 [Aulographum hederae CBS 113979]
MAATGPQVSLTDLPDLSQKQMAFHDSTWFRTHGLDKSLPRPDQVRARCPASDPLRPRSVVKFEEFELAVKFGKHVTTYEAVCLRTVKQMLSNKVPVPEVYGWMVDDKQSICGHLRLIFQALRSARQDPSMQFIGSLSNGPSRDRVLDLQRSSGPWPTVARFHNWLSWLWRRHAPGPDAIADLWRQLLNDSSPIVLTHGDVHQSNIIVSATSPAHLLAIIDWEQSGWYPTYWEYCKTVHTVAEYDEWRSARWIDSVFTPHPDAEEAFDLYTGAIGP